MSKYDLHPLGQSGSFLLDVQTDLLDDIASRVVVPVVPIAEIGVSPSALYPKFEIDGEDFVLVTPSLAAVLSTSLTHPVGNIAEHHDQITRALDFLFQGY